MVGQPKPKLSAATVANYGSGVLNYMKIQGKPVADRDQWYHYQTTLKALKRRDTPKTAERKRAGLGAPQTGRASANQRTRAHLRRFANNRVGNIFASLRIKDRHLSEQRSGALCKRRSPFSLIQPCWLIR